MSMSLRLVLALGAAASVLLGSVVAAFSPCARFYPNSKLNHLQNLQRTFLPADRDLTRRRHSALFLWGSDTSTEDNIEPISEEEIVSEKESQNPLESLLSLFGSGEEEEIATKTDRELEIERREILAEGEILRQEQVRQDFIPYLVLLVLQVLPLIGTDRIFSFIYFFGVAVSTVYVGGRQIALDDPDIVSRKNALYAPLGASFAIGVLYLLLKMGIDPTGLYAIGATLFGAVAISDAAVPILRNVLPESFARAEVTIPPNIAKRLKLDPPTLPVDGLSTLAIGLLFAAIYLSPVPMAQKFLVSNVLAWALAMVSLGSISLGSFQTGALLLGGLFFYDIFWVFGTDVMMTVATKVEAPVKFLYTAPDAPERTYPFSVLGLGDVVIPGLFVRFMSKLDEVLQPKTVSYFAAGTAAYAAGLLACFGVNELTHAGQPALLYLDPCCVGSALACAAANGQVQQVWEFREDNAEDEVQQ